MGEAWSSLVVGGEQPRRPRRQAVANFQYKKLLTFRAWPHLNLFDCCWANAVVHLLLLTSPTLQPHLNAKAQGLRVAHEMTVVYELIVH